MAFVRERTGLDCFCELSHLIKAYNLIYFEIHRPKKFLQEPLNILIYL